MSTTNFEDGRTPIVASWLNDVDAHVYDQESVAHQATNINYTPSGTGAVATDVQSKLRELKSVIDFGADPTGVVEASSVFSAAQETGYLVLIPPGTYKLNGVNTTWTTAGYLGVLKVGNTPTNNSADAVILASRKVDDTVSGNGHCFSDSSAVSRSGNMSYASYDARFTVTGSNNYGHFAPFQNGMVYGSSGSVGYLYGYVDVPQITAGTAQYRFGARIQDIIKSGSGAVTTNTGVWIDQLTAGSINYAIRQVGTTPSKFDGPVTVGKLEVIPADGTTPLIYSTAANYSSLGGPLDVKALQVTGQGLGNDGGIEKHPTAGLLLRAVAGSTYDAAMLKPGGSAYVYTVPTGTNDLKLFGKIGFQGAAPLAKPTVTGSRGGNAALTSLITALANYGLITDSTTA